MDTISPQITTYVSISKKITSTASSTSRINLLGKKCLHYLFILILNCSATIFINASATQLAASKLSNKTVYQHPLRVAVASNFYPILKQLIQHPEVSHLNIQLISGASGILYQQIRHGAPFDVFLSADALRPKQLVNNNIAVNNSLHTYAIGELVLFSKNKKLYSHNNIAALTTLIQNTPKLAIANPNIAPYGKAAKEVLVQLNLWSSLKNKLITGVNVNQTFQQALSGAVNLAIVAKSQLVLNNLQGVNIPKDLYSPIEQQLVLIKNAKNAKQANEFIDFILSPAIQNELSAWGYTTTNIIKREENE